MRTLSVTVMGERTTPPSGTVITGSVLLYVTMPQGGVGVRVGVRVRVGVLVSPASGALGSRPPLTARTRCGADPTGCCASGSDEAVRAVAAAAVSRKPT